MKKALMLLAVATVGLGAANAWAVDNRILPGMMCQKISGGTPSVGWNGSMANVSTSSDLQVACPIVRDNTNAAPFALTVFFVDTNPNEAGSCQFYSTDSGSDNVYWGNNPASTWTWGGTPQAIYPQISNGSYNLGTEFLYCKIPPMSNGTTSAVVSYVVQE